MSGLDKLLMCKYELYEENSGRLGFGELPWHVKYQTVGLQTFEELLFTKIGWTLMLYIFILVSITGHIIKV